MSFLFIWQLSFSAPLSIASGCIGLADYAGYLWPSLERTLVDAHFHLGLPLIGPLEASVLVMPATWVAIATCASWCFLLYRRITVVGKLARAAMGRRCAGDWLGHCCRTDTLQRGAGVRFSAGRIHALAGFFTGLGSAMLIATYDYWGYYNVCFLGGEVKDPGRTIPRALIISILAVAAIYIVMNISVLGVIPWRELASHSSGAEQLRHRRCSCSAFTEPGQDGRSLC